MNCPALIRFGCQGVARSKYLYLFQLGIQNTLVYRINFLCRAAFNIVPLIAIIALWRAVYEQKPGVISRYTISEMIAYYVLVTIIDTLTSVTEDDWQIAADIKDGAISQFLTRPVNYIGYRLCLFFSGRVVFTFAAAGPVVLFLSCQTNYFVWQANFITVLCFLISILLSALLQFFISFALATLAFWVLEISSFVFVLLAFQRLLGGQMFPLDVLPPGLARVISFTPFAYQTFFPATLYLGRMSERAMLGGLLIQASWVVLAWLLARLCWRRGVRSYAAVGG